MRARTSSRTVARWPCCARTRNWPRCAQSSPGCERGAGDVDIAKGRFLAVVSHELRTPLNAIIGFSDMLLHEMFGTFTDPRQKEYVGLVRESGQHLLAVVTSILDVSKIEAAPIATEPEPFRFAEAVEMCRSMMRCRPRQKNIALQAEIAPDAGEIIADRRAVQQMLINLRLQRRQVHARGRRGRRSAPSGSARGCISG